MDRQLLDAVTTILDRVAEAEVMPRWRNLSATEVAEKAGPDDLVTIADKAAEQALAGALEALLPGSRVVGEEAVAADPALRRQFGEPGPLWVIDPIDGTSAFAAGEPDFTIMVALIDGGQPVAGWILAPVNGDLILGGAAPGVWQRRPGRAAEPMARPPVPAHIANMVGLLGRRNITPERAAGLRAREHRFKALDGVVYAGIDYARLARGTAQFVVYNKTEPWDHLPGLAILSGLGFHYARHDGSPYRPGDNTGGLLVAPDAPSWPVIHDALLGP